MKHRWLRLLGSLAALCCMAVEPAAAVESYRLSRAAFSPNGIVGVKQVEEFLKLDAELLKVGDPLKGAAAFDFSLQREVNQELAKNNARPALRYRRA
jgi:hypothetical protein